MSSTLSIDGDGADAGGDIGDDVQCEESEGSAPDEVRGDRMTG